MFFQNGLSGTSQRNVWDESFVRKWSSCEGTGVSFGDPLLNDFSFIGDTISCDDRVFHNFCSDRAFELIGDAVLDSALAFHLIDTMLILEMINLFIRY